MKCNWEDTFGEVFEKAAPHLQTSTFYQIKIAKKDQFVTTQEVSIVVFFVLMIPSFLKILSLCLVCFTTAFFFNDFSLEWLFCLWFECIVTMEMQSRDYYYHFQTYLPTRSSGLLRPRNIK